MPKSQTRIQSGVLGRSKSAMSTNKGFGCVRDCSSSGSSVSESAVESDNPPDGFLRQDLVEDSQRGAITTLLFGEALPHGNESRSGVGARDRDRPTNSVDPVRDNRCIFLEGRKKTFLCGNACCLLQPNHHPPRASYVETMPLPLPFALIDEHQS